MLIFCVRCYRLLGPSTPVYEEIYKNEPVCLTCRKEGGEHSRRNRKKLSLSNWRSSLSLCQGPKSGGSGHLISIGTSEQLHSSLEKVRVQFVLAICGVDVES